MAWYCAKDDKTELRLVIVVFRTIGLYVVISIFFTFLRFFQNPIPKVVTF